MIKAERQRLRALTPDTGTVLKFVNPLTDNAQRWNTPQSLLRNVDATLWPGSLNLNLPQDTPPLRQHMSKVTPLAREVLERDFPTLGICFGHQTLVQVAGGRVDQIPERAEKGTVNVNLTPDGLEEPLLENMPDPTSMIFSHLDSAAEIPPGAVILGKTERDPHSMLRLGNNIITMQGHPELTHKDITIENGVPLTHDLTPRDPTDRIVVNFFNQVAREAQSAQAAYA